MSPRKFRNLVFRYWEQEGRHDLPWRKTHDPYRILVSEIMLQQTQVERVAPLYREFLKRFPNVRALSRAPLSSVLTAWQGLGYNRRAKMLHDAARVVVREHGGNVPTDIATLESLPGVGPYTARAVAAFAANTDSIFIETNIRTAIIYHFFAEENTTIYSSVPDRDITRVLEAAYPSGRAREWYAALMDYGAHLKRTGVRVNARSASYTKQTRFAGSRREARGALLRELSRGSATAARLHGLLGIDRKEQLQHGLAKLIEEGMVVQKGRRYQLP